jgi:hypothetical protein
MTEQQWVIYRARSLWETMPDGTMLERVDPAPEFVCRVTGTQKVATFEVRRRNVATKDCRHHYGCMLAEYWRDR